MSTSDTTALLPNTIKVHVKQDRYGNWVATYDRKRTQDNASALSAAISAAVKHFGVARQRINVIAMPPMVKSVSDPKRTYYTAGEYTCTVISVREAK